MSGIVLRLIRGSATCVRRQSRPASLAGAARWLAAAAAYLAAGVVCLAAGVVCLAAVSAWGAEFPQFERHEIGRAGNKLGQTSLVDVDKDGDLDFITGCDGGDIWWFEYQGPDRWVRHLIGRRVGTQVGGTAIDVNGDRDVDICSKPWNGDLHIYLENLAVERRGSPQ